MVHYRQKFDDDDDGEIHRHEEEHLRGQPHLEFRNACRRLRFATTPLYEDIFPHLLAQDAGKGIHFLVALREDLMLLLQLQSKEEKMQNHNSKILLQSHSKQLKQLDHYLRSLLQG